MKTPGWEIFTRELSRIRGRRKKYLEELRANFTFCIVIIFAINLNFFDRLKKIKESLG